MPVDDGRWVARTSLPLTQGQVVWGARAHCPPMHVSEPRQCVPPAGSQALPADPLATHSWVPGSQKANPTQSPSEVHPPPTVILATHFKDTGSQKSVTESHMELPEPAAQG